MTFLKIFFHNYIIKNKGLILFVLNLYFAIFGLFWIAFYMYFRLLKKHNTYLIVDLKNNISSITLEIFIFFVLIHFSIILGIILSLYRRRYNGKPNRILILLSEKFSLVVEIIYWKPLNSIYKKIEGNVPGSGRFFLFIEQYLTINQKGQYYFYFIVFIFEVLPKSIMAITFFIDVVIFGQISYFVSTMSLIFIPIAFNITLKLMVSFSENNIPLITNYFLVIKGEGDKYFNRDRTIITYEKYYYEIKNEYEDVIDPDEELNLLRQLQRVYIYAYGIKKDIEMITPYLAIFTSSLYMIAGIVRIMILYL